MKFRLTLEIDYGYEEATSTDGLYYDADIDEEAVRQDAKNCLEEMVQQAMQNGVLTDWTDLVIEDYTVVIEEVS